MKKILVLIISMVVLVGCGEKKSSAEEEIRKYFESSPVTRITREAGGTAEIAEIYIRGKYACINEKIKTRNQKEPFDFYLMVKETFTEETKRKFGFPSTWGYVEAPKFKNMSECKKYIDDLNYVKK